MIFSNLFRRQYRHTNSKGVTYKLYYKMVELRGGHKQPIYFFHKGINRSSGVGVQKAQKVYELPDHLRIRENPRNGFLTVGRPETGEEED